MIGIGICVRCCRNRVAACPPLVFTASSPPAAYTDIVFNISENCRSCVLGSNRKYAPPETLAKYWSLRAV